MAWQLNCSWGHNGVISIRFSLALEPYHEAGTTLTRFGDMLNSLQKLPPE